MQNSPQSGKPRVTVLGSLNIDHIWTLPQLPTRGQTVLARTVRTEFGGKGANQAVAAARQGAAVAMLGSVGADTDGLRYREHLERMQIATSAVLVHAEAVTGSAHVYVDANGDNLIAVNSGANWLLEHGLVEELLPQLLAQCQVLLVQLESPLPVVRVALRQAALHGVRSVLNASPYNQAFGWDEPVDTVIVNEHECVDFFRQQPGQLLTLPDKVRRAFLGRHQLQNLIVTQGHQPTLWLSAAGVLAVPTYGVEPKDTVGAGDTFAGVLAVQLAEGATWADALWRANVAAALSTLSTGAQSAMPTRAHVDQVAQTNAMVSRA